MSFFGTVASYRTDHEGFLLDLKDTGALGYSVCFQPVARDLCNPTGEKLMTSWAQAFVLQIKNRGHSPQSLYSIILVVIDSLSLKVRA